MEKMLSIHDARDTMEDDQRQFERTVAELKSRAIKIAKDRKPGNIPSGGRMASEGGLSGRGEDVDLPAGKT